MRTTRDDERARRICSLALAFMNASAPLPSSEVARRFYPDLSPDSFRRAFSRDRAVLDVCGMHVEEAGEVAGESSWRAGDSSFAGTLELGAREAAALEVACQPLLSDPEFPLSGDLRIALAKVSRAFVDETAGSRESRQEPRALAPLREALVRARAARITYTDARGETTTRRIAPYGFFGLRDELYLVAGLLDDEGRIVPDNTRTYRVGRVVSAEVVEDVACEVPEGFSVLDWRRLPFQIGPTSTRASFEVPAERADDLRSAAGASGSFRRQGGRLVWEVEVSSVEGAARWAVAEGLVPLGPAEVVDAWRDVLEGVLGDAS